MQRYIFSLALVLFSSAMFIAEATQFEEGLHYHELSTDKSDSPLITEFFSFYCASCYQYQPFNQQLKARWPGVLVEHHASGPAPRGFENTIQRAWAAARLLDVDEEFAALVFERNFVQRKQITDVDTLYSIFSSLGIEQAELTRTMQGFQARSLVRRMQVEEERYEINGTPTYIVNGRYLMDYRAFRNSENFFDEYLQLASYLLEK